MCDSEFVNVVLTVQLPGRNIVRRDSAVIWFTEDKLYKGHKVFTVLNCQHSQQTSTHWHKRSGFCAILSGNLFLVIESCLVLESSGSRQKL